MDVELLDGLLVDLATEGEVHVRIVGRFVALFAGRPDLLRVNGSLPVRDGWMPQPDIALARMDEGDWRKRPDRAELVVEVAISSLLRDRFKAAVYARGAIPRYWLVDVHGGVVLDHSEPTPTGYERVTPLRGRDVLDAQVDGIRAMKVAELLAGTRP
jgi:Uma2 family endonuclease